MSDLVEMAREMERLSRLLDDGLAFLREQATEVAHAEHDYRLARAEAWQSTTGTAKQREDAVNGLTAGERRRRDTAENMKQAAIESVRSRRQQISAWQTLVGAHKAEAEFARTGPRVSP